MQCKTCGAGDKVEIATKTTRRDAAGITRCHRLECGHAWHVVSSPPEARAPGADGLEAAEPARCTCGEIATVNSLLAEGRHHAALGGNLTEDTFRRWLEQVLQALDGIPAESSAPSLVRAAATVAKSPVGGMSKKMSNLNDLLGRAIKAVS